MWTPGFRAAVLIEAGAAESRELEQKPKFKPVFPADQRAEGCLPACGEVQQPWLLPLLPSLACSPRR